MQLFSGEAPAVDVTATRAAVSSSGDERVAQLEGEVAELRREVAEMREQLAAFRKQFE
jgi:hypothetical protein